MHAPTTADTPSTPRRQLVLLGAGATHLALLQQLARRPIVSLELVLVAPHDPVFLADAMPDFVAGARSASQCSVALAPLLRASSARWLPRRAIGLDAAQHTLLLDNGDALNYDLLSINTGLAQSRAGTEALLPGAREHGLFVDNAQAFAALWPRVLALPPEQLRSIAVIGASSIGVQVALALRQRLAHVAITLITGGQPVLPEYPLALQRAVRQALQKQAVTLLPQRACALAASEIHLLGGARLVCDVALLAVPTKPPSWLLQGGLAPDPQRALEVDAAGRSVRHPQVFLQGDLRAATPVQRQRTPLHSWRAAAALRANLVRLCAGQQARPIRLQPPSLALLSGTYHQAFACWGSWAFQGWLAWQGRNLLQRCFMARLPQAGLDKTLT